VYDITDHESFENISHWYNEMNNNVNQKVACMLVGNKLDMSSKRAVTFQEGKELADKYGIQFMETSAKTAENVNQLFSDITTQMIKINEGTATKPKRLKPPLVQKPKNEEYCSCCET
jgi:GTPase SAR1 family protein